MLTTRTLTEDVAAAVREVISEFHLASQEDLGRFETTLGGLELEMRHRLDSIEAAIRDLDTLLRAKCSAPEPNLD